MNDREMVELAAKAIRAKAWEPSFKGDHRKFTAEGFSGWFSPLEFKDHALSLAVQLRITIEPTDYDGKVNAYIGSGKVKLFYTSVSCPGDRMRSTMRVITSVAAQLGAVTP